MSGKNLFWAIYMVINKIILVVKIEHINIEYIYLFLSYKKIDKKDSFVFFVI